MGGWLSHFTRSQEQHEAAELTEHARTSGAEEIGHCARGQKVHVCGTIRSVTLRPRAKAPALEAEIFDGTGHLTLVSLGRRQLAGIEVGRMVEAHGRVTCPHGSPAIFNPDYALLPAGAE